MDSAWGDAVGTHCAWCLDTNASAPYARGGGGRRVQGQRPGNMAPHGGENGRPCWCSGSCWGTAGSGGKQQELSSDGRFPWLKWIFSARETKRQLIKSGVEKTPLRGDSRERDVTWQEPSAESPYQIDFSILIHHFPTEWTRSNG